MSTSSVVGNHVLKSAGESSLSSMSFNADFQISFERMLYEEINMVIFSGQKMAMFIS